LKILVVSDNPTHPPLAGNRACIVTYSQLLKEMGHEVHLLYSHRSWVQTPAELDSTRRAWGERFHLHTQSALDRLLQIAAHRIRFPLHKGYPLDSLCPIGMSGTTAQLATRLGVEAVIVNYWSMTEAFLHLPPTVRKILYAHDRFSDKLHRTGGKWLSTTRATEATAMERSDVVLAIQEEEAAFFRTLTTKPVLTAFAHFPVVTQPFTGRKVVLYLGGPNRPNIEGLSWFLDNAWPLVQSRDPEIRMLVGGRICREMGGYAKTENVELQGDVERLEDFYAQGDLTINPTRTGTGLKIKTFEAMAHGKTLICHPHCAEGIFEPGTAPLSVATTPDEFASAICRHLAEAASLSDQCEESTKYIHRFNAHVMTQFENALKN
jgi:hypothetical protein